MVKPIAKVNFKQVKCAFFGGNWSRNDFKICYSSEYSQQCDSESLGLLMECVDNKIIS